MTEVDRIAREAMDLSVDERCKLVDAILSSIRKDEAIARDESASTSHDDAMVNSRSRFSDK